MTTTTVVYVEDNPDNFGLVKIILESTGQFEVLGTENGLAGLSLVRERRPALVLVDLDIPLLDGLELAREIRGDPSLDTTPIIAISANVMRGERRRCLDAGCQAFVEKPFDICEFKKTVERVVARDHPPG